jgi:hypothetical protein
MDNSDFHRIRTRESNHHKKLRGGGKRRGYDDFRQSTIQILHIMYLGGGGGRGRVGRESSYCVLIHSVWMKTPLTIIYYAIPPSRMYMYSLPKPQKHLPPQTTQGRDCWKQSTSEHVPTQGMNERTATASLPLVPTLNNSYYGLSTIILVSSPTSTRPAHLQVYVPIHLRDEKEGNR